VDSDDSDRQAEGTLHLNLGISPHLGPPSILSLHRPGSEVSIALLTVRPFVVSLSSKSSGSKYNDVSLQ